MLSIKMPDNIPVIITREKLKGKNVYIAECPLVNVASQGHTIEKAMENLKQALISYFKSPFSDKNKLKEYEDVVLFGGINLSLHKKLV